MFGRELGDPNELSEDALVDLETAALSPIRRFYRKYIVKSSQGALYAIDNLLPCGAAVSLSESNLKRASARFTKVNLLLLVIQMS